MARFSPDSRLVIILLATSLVFSACKKDPGPGNNPVDDTVYTSPCQIQELIWFADNVTVLINDRCGSNIYILNTVTKAIKNWTFSPSFLVQRFYYTKDIPGKIFFTTMTKQSSGAFTTPMKLYSLGIDNLDTSFIKGDIADNPFAMGYTGGGKKLIVKTSTNTVLIDLETGSSQNLAVTGDPQAFSPDNSKILFYPYFTTPITNAFTFDLNCMCTSPITLAGNGKALWRTPGIFSYAMPGLPPKLEFQNLQTGVVIKSFPDFLTGPWISPGSNLAILYIKSNTFSTDLDGILIGYDFISNQTREFAHAKYSYSVLKGIYMSAVSIDERKLAYVVDGIKLKIISL